MENHYQSAFDKHFQGPLNEPAFGLHTIHAMAEYNDIELFVAIIRTTAGTTCATVRKLWGLCF